MVELTTPFWLASTVLTETQTVNDWLKSQRIQPRWIDEVIRICNPAGAEALAVTGINEDVPQLQWPGGLYSESHYLQTACREIAVTNRQMILLLSDSGHQRTAVILAAPAAVGMYNLLPQTYVEELSSSRLPEVEADLLSSLDQILLKKQKKTVQVKELLLIQPSGKRPVKSETTFSSAGWVKETNPDAGTMAACHNLVQTLLKKQQSNGLAVDMTADRQLYLIWIERV
jgi:hypothetical protein